jgi:hypothetical protein
MIRAIQYTDTARNEQEAREMLSALASLNDYLGGRVLPPPSAGWWRIAAANPDTQWRIQVFFADDPNAGVLPEDCRRVVVPAGTLRALGVRIAA